MQWHSAFGKRLWSLLDAGMSVPPLPELVEKTFMPSQDQLTFWAVGAESHPITALRRRVPKTVNCEFRRVGDVGAVAIQEDDQQYVVAIWPSESRGIWNFVGAVPVTDPRWQRVESWVRRTSPAVSPLYLNEDHLGRTCATLSEHGPVQVSRMTARVVKDGSSYTRGWKSDSPVPRPTYQQALAEVRTFATVRTLAVSVGDSLSVHLRRGAGATFYSGDFGLFHGIVVERINAESAKMVELLSGRERVARQPVPKPLSLSLRSGYFEDRAHLRAMLDGLDGVSGAGVSVVHHNPYLQFVVTDYRDGSNFNVFVTEQDQIRVYPGFRASGGALARIVEALGDLVSPESVHEADHVAEFSDADFLVAG